MTTYYWNKGILCITNWTISTACIHSYVLHTLLVSISTCISTELFEMAEIKTFFYNFNNTKSQSSTSIRLLWFSIITKHFSNGFQQQQVIIIRHQIRPPIYALTVHHLWPSSSSGSLSCCCNMLGVVVVPWLIREKTHRSRLVIRVIPNMGFVHASVPELIGCVSQVLTVIDRCPFP